MPSHQAAPTRCPFDASSLLKTPKLWVVAVTGCGPLLARTGKPRYISEPSRFAGLPSLAIKRQIIRVINTRLFVGLAYLAILVLAWLAYSQLGAALRALHTIGLY